MNVLQNMIDLYNRLPHDSTYRSVLTGILTHMDEVSKATIYDVAEMTNSSRTTIWRMVQKMGYENYSDFRFALRQAVQNYTYFNRIIPHNMIAQEQNTAATIAAELRSAAELVETDVEYEQIKKMAQKLIGMEQISFYFPYQSSALASFQQNLCMSGKIAGIFTLLPDIKANTELLDEKSIVFCMTIEYAEALDMTEVFKMAKAQGAAIIMMSRKESRYERYVDEYVFDWQKGSSVFSEIITYDAYFYMLSEVFRRSYIE